MPELVANYGLHGINSYICALIMADAWYNVYGKPCLLYNLLHLTIIMYFILYEEGSVSFILSNMIISQYTCSNIRYVSTVHYIWF